MAESIQKKLTKERPPRVRITYDVETGDAIVKAELAFVMGVIADLSGDRSVARTIKTKLPDGTATETEVKLKDYPDREFIEIDKDNFNTVMADFMPRVRCDLAAVQGGKGPITGKIDIAFNKLDDFKPDNLMQNISPLASLLVERNRLRDLYTKMDIDKELFAACSKLVGDLLDSDSKAAERRKKREELVKNQEELKKSKEDPKKTEEELKKIDHELEEAAAKLKDIEDELEKTLKQAVDTQTTAVKNSLAVSGFDQESAEFLAKYLADNRKNLSDKLKTPANRNNLIKVLISEVSDKDKVIGAYMDAILHDKGFQKLEAAWRGLFHLVRYTATGTFLKIRVLNASPEEVFKDLSEALDFDQSSLFKMVYEETYGTQGGSPYSCLLMDHYFGEGNPQKDMELLKLLTGVAAAAHAPLLTAPAPGLFNLKSFVDLAAPRDLAKIFESAQHIEWSSLRELEDSRYLAMCLPRVLLRAPYTRDQVKSFEYDETTGKTADEKDKASPLHENYLWGNAAYAMGARITAAFADYGWTAAIRGMEGGGLVEGLPVHTYTRASGDIVSKIPTETAITDRREKELSDLGFISLCYRLGTDKAVFFGAQTVNKPIQYLEADATANARLSARLPYMLNASRFAHYIKKIMRDKIGSFLDRESVEKYLNTWLGAYVLLSDAAPQSVKAGYPLREGRVDVTDDPSDPGVYRAVMYLRPHFQMEELTVSIRLVAKLPAPAV